MLPSELPTERAVLRAALYLQQKKIFEEGIDKSIYHVKEMMTDILPRLKMQWLTANLQFSGQVIVSDKQILDKLVQKWQAVAGFGHERLGQKKKGNLMN